jgi:hypothetical protein
MLATQAIEFLWILLSYLGIEYQRVDARGVLHLDYLPFSHSLLTGLGAPILAYAVIRWGFKRPTLALAVGLAMASHIVYDVIQHEPDIRIAPGVDQPRLGLHLSAIPAADFLVETGLGVACWWYFGGDWKLLAALIFLNLTNLPLMFGGSGSGAALANNHFILPSIILAQTALSLLLIWWFGHRRGDAIGAEAERETPPQRGAVAPA